MSLTSTHFFCGGGGDTEGLRQAGYDPRIAINHDQASIDTHEANFPDAEHECCDINNLDMRRLPKTTALWGSPICWESSPAGGRKKAKRKTHAQLELLKLGPIADSTWERTRNTSYDVLRAAETVGYDVVFCENVIEWTEWPLFEWWLGAMEIIDYNVTLTCVSAAHIGGPGNIPAPQWRDRVFVVFTRKGIPIPDLEPHPIAWCEACGKDVESYRWWKNPDKNRIGKHLIGKYGKRNGQYVYRCPNMECRHAIVEPYVRPVSTVIDWNDLGTPVGDRTGRPIVAATRARIEAGLAKAYGLVTPQPFITVLRNNQTAIGVDGPVTTIAAGGGHHGLTTPPGAFFVKNYGGPADAKWVAKSVTEPAGAITSKDHHALVVPYYSNGRVHPTSEPVGTMTARDRFGLLSPAERVDACLYRMFKPVEQFGAQRFPEDYIRIGSPGAQTAMAGNAVPCNVAQWIGTQVAAAMDGRVA